MIKIPFLIGKELLYIEIYINKYLDIKLLLYIYY